MASTSSSERVRAVEPETSSVPTAASTIRSVAVVNSSRAFIEVARSSRSRALRSLTRRNYSVLMRRRSGLPLALLATAAATTAYAGLVERTRWTLRRFDVPALAPGSAPFRILHVSDMHMTEGQAGKQEWIRGLDALDPDLVLSTGDHIAGQTAVPAALSALGPLLARPGAFVFGSNDYYAP